MWKATSRTEDIGPGISRTRLMQDDGSCLSHGRVLELLRDDDYFRGFFNAVITISPFTAFFWETPAVTKATLGQPFEFVLVESGGLERLTADPGPFAEHFGRSTETVLIFPNLGGDAMLVVPAPISEHANYTHLARFIRHAPAAQIDAFWRCAGEKMMHRVSDKPVWLSTAGMGVSWLHLRLDSQPKYYRHGEYMKIAN
ncbi:MAG TPA: hypothetical protein VG733_09285 [Chthoniobacteraceae bacterium]|nr:hypothetical protein [Chthoniobacteraceae bacterium]